MNETSKTVAFVISACLLGAAAGATHWMTQPKSVAGFEKVGQDFFPDFEDAFAARTLEVMVYDTESDGVRDFSVNYQDGLWRIPSHHDYPAEAADRLARTATSVIGLKRESLVARRASQHEKYGVVDPADPEATPESAGQRITLRDENEDILVDYLIGKPAGSVAEDDASMVRDMNQESDYYYVRIPDEKETYKAKVEIDLSTRFADWINPDLLKIESADDIQRLEIDNYELVESQVRAPVGSQMQVTRKSLGKQLLTRNGVEPWRLDGLNPETEELQDLKVEQLITLLNNMRIVGVRPKLKYNGQLLVKSDLTVNRELAQQNPAAFQDRVFALQSELEYKGFTIGADEDAPEKISLMASRGELRATTSQGVLYTLYFGRSVTGDEAEIEVGAARDESAEATNENEDASATAENEGSDGAAEGSGENRNRYVAIRVDFDIAALGQAPVSPTEPAAPVKPDGYDEWRVEQDKMLLEQNRETPPVDEQADEQENTDESEEGSSEDDDAPAVPDDIAAASDEKFRQYEQDQMQYQQAALQYVTDLETYETAKVDYEERKKNGSQLVEELNERFAEWYYVVPSESLAQLKLSRQDLVNVRETMPPSANSPVSPGSARLPDAPNIDFPSGDPMPGQPDDESASPPDDAAAEEPSATESKPGNEKSDQNDSESDDGRP